MGTPRPRPVRLGEKLLRVRQTLGLSQNELIARLGMTELVTQARVSTYESGVREPPLPVLLAYARQCLGGGAYLELLIDDDMELPDKLPIRKS